MNQNYSAVWLACGIALVGCSDQSNTASNAPVTKAPAIESKPDEKKTEPHEAIVGGFKFQAPADWAEQPPKNQFILGEFTIAGEGGPARLTVSSARGGIDANISRWRTQFQTSSDDPEPRESEITFDGKPAKLVELSGTFVDSSGGSGINKNWRMLGVAASLPDTEFFIKFTGPAATVSPRRDEFLKFVESARMEK